MIYRIFELTISKKGNKCNHTFLFEDEGCALRSLKVLADNRLKAYEDDLISASWLDLEIMEPTYYDLEGELLIDGRVEPIAYQYIDIEGEFINTPNPAYTRHGIDY